MCARFYCAGLICVAGPKRDGSSIKSAVVSDNVPTGPKIYYPVHCLKKKIRKRMEIIVVSSRGVFSGFSFLCPAATPDLENTTWIAT